MEIKMEDYLEIKLKYEKLFDNFVNLKEYENAIDIYESFVDFMNEHYDELSDEYQEDRYDKSAIAEFILKYDKEKIKILIKILINHPIIEHERPVFFRKIMSYLIEQNEVFMFISFLDKAEYFGEDIEWDEDQCEIIAEKIKLKTDNLQNFIYANLEKQFPKKEELFEILKKLKESVKSRLLRRLFNELIGFLTSSNEVSVKFDKKEVVNECEDIHLSKELIRLGGILENPKLKNSIREDLDSFICSVKDKNKAYEKIARPLIEKVLFDILDKETLNNRNHPEWDKFYKKKKLNEWGKNGPDLYVVNSFLSFYFKKQEGIREKFICHKIPTIINNLIKILNPEMHNGDPIHINKMQLVDDLLTILTWYGEYL